MVLATIDSLRRIERGDITPAQHWQLSALKPLNPNVLFEAAGVLHQITGCDLQVAREFLEHLPGKLRLDMYEHQAFALWKRLSRMKMLPVRLERWQANSDKLQESDCGSI
ncbi:MAG: hypothetical protein AB4040_20185 [Synechococcus sp.]